MNKSKKRWLIVLGVVFLIGLILIVLTLGWFAIRGKAFDSRPLVLIHEPTFDDQVQVGDGVIIHATAREENGLSRIELWVNDELLDFLDAEESDTLNLMLLSSFTPTYEGEHQIIVRAFSADDISGQSAIHIYAIPAGEGSAGEHTVVEGDTLESIAEEYGSTQDEIEELNPGIGDGGLVPGEGIIIPDDEPESDGPPPLPESEGEAPMWSTGPALVDSPFSMFDVIPGSDGIPYDEGPVILLLEVPRLTTDIILDSLHCYVGLAESLPQWYPDRDHNQATDESFERIRGGAWDTEGILLGDAAPRITWFEDEALPANITCVGVTGRGEETVDFGRLEIEIPPEEWNGIRHPYMVIGEGGRLTAEVQVSRLIGSSRFTPKTPDPEMIIPTNLRLSEEAGLFLWDYPEDTGIMGFEIFLNGNQMWSERYDERSTALPPEWFNPPCGETYIFGVRAYRWDSEEDDYFESGTGTIDLTQPPEGCRRQIQVTFLSLETFNLGGDGSHEDRHGDVGPVYGTFAANNASVTFDTGHYGSGAVLDLPHGFEHNTLYDLTEMAANPGWGFRGPNSIVADMRPGHWLRVAFFIEDRDTGRCVRGDERGCDDHVCGGIHIPITEGMFNLDEVNTFSIRSSNERCLLTFETRPGPESPVGGSGEGAEPLPWLEIEEMTLDEDSGLLSLEIKNSGSAAWSDRVLPIGLRTRTGLLLNNVRTDPLTIPVGDTVTVEHPHLFVPPPFDYCVILDPNDEVMELHERYEVLAHPVVCQELPDLTIHDVSFVTNPLNRMRLEIQNVGEGDLENRTLEIVVRGEDHRAELFDRPSIPDLTIASGETIVIDIPITDRSIREQMAAGYWIYINSDGSIVESNTGNNDYNVGEATRLSTVVTQVEIPRNLRRAIDYHVRGYINNGRFRGEQVFNFHISGNDVDWDCDPVEGCFEVFRHDGYADYSEDWFDIYGDQELVVVVQFDIPRLLGDDVRTRSIYESPTWNAGYFDLVDGSCHQDYSRVVGHNRFVVLDADGEEWGLTLDLCRENFYDSEDE